MLILCVDLSSADLFFFVGGVVVVSFVDVFCRCGCRRGAAGPGGFVHEYADVCDAGLYFGVVYFAALDAD